MDGRCTCGEVQYRLKDRPLFTHCCHCRWCQRETGSAFVMNAIIEASMVEVTAGAPVAVKVPTESGGGQVIHRCPSCQVALWSVYPGAGPRFYFLRVGTLQDPDACPPDIHIFTESKQPWVTIDTDAPVMKTYYSREARWPDWALARRQAALEA